MKKLLPLLILASSCSLPDIEIIQPIQPAYPSIEDICPDCRVCIAGWLYDRFGNAVLNLEGAHQDCINESSPQTF